MRNLIYKLSPTVVIAAIVKQLAGNVLTDLLISTISVFIS